MIRVQSEGYPLIVVDLAELTPKQAEENTSAALIRGVAARMAALGCPLQDAGLDAYVVSNVPGGSGLSSSAAFEVLIGTMLSELFWNGKKLRRGDRPDRAVRRERLLRKALRPHGPDRLLRGRRGGHRLCRHRPPGGGEHIPWTSMPGDMHCVSGLRRGPRGPHREYAAITDELRGRLPPLRQGGPPGGTGGGLPAGTAGAAEGGRGPGRSAGLPLLCGKPAGRRRGPGPAGRGFRPLFGTGPGLRPLLCPVSAERGAHRSDGAPRS